MWVTSPVTNKIRKILLRCTQRGTSGWFFVLKIWIYLINVYTWIYLINVYTLCIAAVVVVVCLASGSLPRWLQGPKGQPLSHYTGVPCLLLSATGLRYIHIIPDVRDIVLQVIGTCWHPWLPSVTCLRYICISTYMLTLMTSEVPHSLSRRKPGRFLHTDSHSIFQDTGRDTSYPMVLWHVDAWFFGLV